MPVSIQFDWDPAKAAVNVSKHGVAFEDAMLVFDDPLALTIPDPVPLGGEERWITMGPSPAIAGCAYPYRDRRGNGVCKGNLGPEADTQ